MPCWVQWKSMKIFWIVKNNCMQEKTASVGKREFYCWLQGVCAAVLLAHWHSPWFWCLIIELCAARRKHGDSFFRDWLATWDAAYELDNGTFREMQHYLSSVPITVINCFAIPSGSGWCRFLLSQPHQPATVFLWDKETNHCVLFNLFLMLRWKNRYVFNRGLYMTSPGSESTLPKLALNVHSHCGESQSWS